MANRPEEQLPPESRRAIRRAFLALLATGLLIGGITAFGIVQLMDHFNLIGVPEQQR
jgi:hypothetical protein